MASDMCTRRLQRELQNLQKDPIKSPRIVALPHESNILEWHYVIEGSKGTPYEGGHYHGKLIFPKEYPLKPPSVIMLTPSGRFKPNRRLCLSMSDFHPESWNPMWSVSTILTGLYSFMVETGTTLGSIETTMTQKRKLARQSLEFNCNDPNFKKLFPELVELNQQRQEERRSQMMREPLSSSSPMLSTRTQVAGRNDEEARGFFAIAAGVSAILFIGFAMRFL